MHEGKFGEDVVEFGDRFGGGAAEPPNYVEGGVTESCWLIRFWHRTRGCVEISDLIDRATAQ